MKEIIKQSNIVDFITCYVKSQSLYKENKWSELTNLKKFLILGGKKEHPTVSDLKETNYIKS